MKFARWVFTIAGIYGILVLTPMYFTESMAVHLRGPDNYPEYYYGFAGVALAFQVLFLLIGRDPVRLRAAMIPSMLEKLSFVGAVWPLYFAGRTPGITASLASVDLLLTGLFAIAYVKTKPAANG
ncbi:hypothetical protein [Kordiimonas marina]|uniref:hypothetical protein n=1 Tax=Kordiimonas marina TaxID=2872312 RepID=UPI001FF65759|nr:hypothetical protein [Kordiimonas marina]MCJ9428970.1 hypothetical protein [Kordiimonas marina]